jgi:hypothetical protein
MKYLLYLLLAAMMSTCSYAMYQDVTAPPPPTLTKKVVGKFDPVESDMNKRADTHYYLVASDGTRVEVGMGRYATTQVGDSIRSNGWR